MEVGVSEYMRQTATGLGEWVLVLPIVLCLMGSALLLTTQRRGRLGAGLAILVLLAVIACEIVLLARVLEAGPQAMTLGNWLPPFGITINADIFGSAFALASAIATLIVVLYLVSEDDPQATRAKLPLILLLLAGVTGAFLTGDFFNLYVWFEVMLIASFGLFVTGGRGLQIDGAVKYAFLNFFATALFLLALGLIYGLLGTLNMADIAERVPEADGLSVAVIGTVLALAFAMKAAVFPVNTWLPASYHTPHPAVSALFAGLLTKVGAYAMIRALVVMMPEARDMLEPVLFVLAVATLVLGPLGAIAETNLRRAVGFIVIGGIGTILLGIAIAGEQGIAGSGLYIVHAILTMTALYLLAGFIEETTGETDSRRMGGLYAASAPLSILFMILVLAAAGIPPFLGFWPKLMLADAGIARAGLEGTTDWFAILGVAGIVLNAWMTLIAGARLWAHIFWRDTPLETDADGEPAGLEPLGARRRWLGLGTTGALTAMLVLAGLMPGGLVDGALAGAADVVDPARYIAAAGLVPETLTIPIAPDAEAGQ